MTHKDALLIAMGKAGSNKSDLARRLGLKGGIASISPKLNSDVQISGLIAMANALGYEIVMQPIPDNPDMRPAAQLVIDSIPKKKKKAMEAQAGSEAGSQSSDAKGM